MEHFKNFLTESNYDLTWSNYGPNIEKRMREHENIKDNHKEHFEQHLNSADPTPQKKYSQWIARTYSKGGINKLEDFASRVHPNLETFHRHKAKLPELGHHADINQYKSLPDLEAAVDKLPKQEETFTDENHKKAHSESSHHEDENWKIKVPHTEHASKFYGQGTKWCTAANKNCLFNSYNKKGDLHIMVPKKPKYPGEKYQLHTETNSLMNEKDIEPKENPFRERPSGYLKELWFKNKK